MDAECGGVAVGQLVEVHIIRELVFTLFALCSSLVGDEFLFLPPEEAGGDGFGAVDGLSVVALGAVDSILGCEHGADSWWVGSENLESQLSGSFWCILNLENDFHDEGDGTGVAWF